MSLLLSMDQLKNYIADGTVDTVIAAIPDMQGRLMGKRFQAEFFVETAWEETHCCNYLIATDLDMETVSGYESTSWEAGYGDYIMKPDLKTMRLLPWSPGTAFVLCDLLDHHHIPVAHSPRAILKKQIDRLAAMGLAANVATELEFFVFKESFEELKDSHYQGITPISGYNEDYHLFQTAKEEGLMRKIRTGLQGAGLRVENTKGEASAGQAEINVYYADALTTADNHVLIKQAVKEIAFQEGRAVTFMAKWHRDAAGSSSHIHQSIADKEGNPVFYDSGAKNAMSKTMQQYLAGMLKYSDDITLCMAPYVNSYKRFMEGTFAPTKCVWSVDNRTAGFRVVGPDTKGVRVECRIGGSDLNPYLAIATNIAAGLAGIEEGLELPPEYLGNAYIDDSLHQIPKNLPAAVEKFRNSKMLRAALGDDVVDHYARAGEWEQQIFEQQVTVTVFHIFKIYHQISIIFSYMQVLQISSVAIKVL